MLLLVILPPFVINLLVILNNPFEILFDVILDCHRYFYRNKNFIYIFLYYLYKHENSFPFGDGRTNIKSEDNENYTSEDNISLTSVDSTVKPDTVQQENVSNIDSGLTLLKKQSDNPLVITRLGLDNERTKLFLRREVL